MDGEERADLGDLVRLKATPYEQKGDDRFGKHRKSEHRGQGYDEGEDGAVFEGFRKRLTVVGGGMAGKKGKKHRVDGD